MAATSLAIAGLTVAGCGSSSKSGGNGEAGKPPKQILDDAAKAIGQSHGFRLAGNLVQGSTSQQLSLGIVSATTFQMSITQKGQTFNVIVTPSGSFVKGDTAFWTAQGGAAAATKFANKWVTLPASQSKQLTSGLGALAPSKFAYCLAHEHHGTLTNGGTTTVDGQSAIVLKDAGNAPGDQLGTLAIASSGPPYPLRIVATGKQTPGGAGGTCGGNSGGPSQDGTLTLSDFGKVSVSPPSNPISLTTGAST